MTELDKAMLAPVDPSIFKALLPKQSEDVAQSSMHTLNDLMLCPIDPIQWAIELNRPVH